MDHSMPMAFYFGYDHVTVLFEKWHVMGDPAGFAWMCIGVFVMGIVYEVIQSLQFAYDRKYLRAMGTRPYSAFDSDATQDPPAFDWRAQLVRSLLYFVSTSLSLALMLVVMTFNAGLFLSVVGGQALGFFLFRRQRYTSETPINCH